MIACPLIPPSEYLTEHSLRSIYRMSTMRYFGITPSYSTFSLRLKLYFVSGKKSSFPSILPATGLATPLQVMSCASFPPFLRDLSDHSTLCYAMAFLISLNSVDWFYEFSLSLRKDTLWAYFPPCAPWTCFMN